MAKKPMAAKGNPFGKGMDKEMPKKGAAKGKGGKGKMPGKMAPPFGKKG